MKKISAGLICLAIILSLFGTNALAAGADASLLKTPYDLTLVQLKTDADMPFGGVELHFKIDNMPAQIEGDGPSYWLDFEKKVGSGDWEEFHFNPIDMFGEGYGFVAPNSYMATDTWGEDASAMVVSYRVRMMIYAPTTVYAASPWSNVATLGIVASSWATEDIAKALNYGIVPDSIKSDYTRPITREEFAELAVRFYEVYTGKSAVASPADTFSDCTNPEVLKAFKLLIVSGVGGGKFDPKTLTNREQIAAMLYRAIKAIEPTADLSTAGAPKFSDDNNVSSYFVESVKFMAKKGFILGSAGKFDPKGTCTREMAVLIAVRVFEHYKGV